MTVMKGIDISGWQEGFDLAAMEVRSREDVHIKIDSIEAIWNADEA